MATEIEYALMAGGSYLTTSNPINQFPVPIGWSQIPNSHVVGTGFLPSGFEAVSFVKGNEIVISYAGTGDLLDWLTNLSITDAQIVQAAEYYLQIKENNPGKTISFTGHSLGGGLASLMAVFFNEKATTFDQAPFRGRADNATANILFDSLVSSHDIAELLELINFKSKLLSIDVPNEANVTDFSVPGEVLSLPPFTLASRIGTKFLPLDHGVTDASRFSLHSLALLTAFLQSEKTDSSHSLSDVTYKLTDLLKMIFSKDLFYFDTDTQLENFLEHLIRYEFGNAPAAGGAPGVSTANLKLLTRFTEDLWKIAQDGGLTLDQQIVVPGVADAPVRL